MIDQIAWMRRVPFEFDQSLALSYKTVQLVGMTLWHLHDLRVDAQSFFCLSFTEVIVGLIGGYHSQMDQVEARCGRGM